MVERLPGLLFYRSQRAFLARLCPEHDCPRYFTHTLPLCCGLSVLHQYQTIKEDPSYQQAVPYRTTATHDPQAPTQRERTAHRVCRFVSSS